MIHFAVGFGRGFPRIWLLPIGALTVVLGVAASGRWSRSIVADLLAWWPVWLGIAVIAVVFRDRKVGRMRASGLIPLVALLLVGLFTWGHLAGWEMMPSASQRLVGPGVGGFSAAAITAEVNGVVQVQGGSQFLYQVEPVKRGGRIGIPTASEQVIDSSVAVELEAPSDPGLYSYAGWNLALADAPLWTLSLEGAVDADLASLHIDQLAVAGSGVVRLGEPEGATGLAVEGSFHIVVPEDVPARVNGRASVPASWALDEIGAMSPVAGEGWVITVGPETSVTVSEASEAG